MSYTKKALEIRRVAARAKAGALRAAWQAGNPGEACSVERRALIATEEEGKRELAEVNRELKKIESKRRFRLVKRWLRGLPKEHVKQMMVWMHLHPKPKTP